MIRTKRKIALLLLLLSAVTLSSVPSIMLVQAEDLVDDQPPLITDEGFEEGFITATITDDVGVAAVNAYYSVDGVESAIALTETVDNTYVGSIPGYDSAKTYTWWVEATDTSGNAAKTTPASEVGIIGVLEELKAVVSSMTDEELGATAENRVNSLCNKIDAVEQMIAGGEYNGAWHKLEHDIKPKLDASSPQSWIRNPSDKSDEALELARDVQSRIAEENGVKHHSTTDGAEIPDAENSSQAQGRGKDKGKGLGKKHGAQGGT